MMEAVYIFLYSRLENDFGYGLVKACQHYSTIESRAKHNPARKLNIYTLLTTEEETKKINKLIQKDKKAAWDFLKTKSLEVKHG